MSRLDRGYSTDAGFFVGDNVELPDGRKGSIHMIVLRNVNIRHNSETYITASVVRVTHSTNGDLGLWLDHQLTRIE